MYLNYQPLDTQNNVKNFDILQFEKNSHDFPV